MLQNNTIKYLGYFDFQDSIVPRNYPLACTNKMESIAEAIIAAGFKVEIISSAVGTNDKFFFSPGEIIRKNDKLSAKFFPTIGAPNKFLRFFRRIVSDLYLLKFLFFEIKRDEPIIVYHSFGYRNLILLAKKIKKFKLILELEEIYQDVLPLSKKARYWEYKTVKAADAYIFPTELLNTKVNNTCKPCSIILGTYHVEPQIVEPFGDDKTHVVYAGTLDPRKGGALAAAAAEYLPDSYVLHICGFGSQDEINMVLEIIDQTNKKYPGKVIYHGTLKGKEYITLLQKCQIGLSTQNPNAEFNATSFPSKILSYMANGLEVVSIDIPAVKDSAIGKYIHYYHNQTPQDIAEAIESCKYPSFNTRSVITTLYKNFILDVQKLINYFN